MLCFWSSQESDAKFSLSSCIVGLVSSDWINPTVKNSKQRIIEMGKMTPSPTDNRLLKPVLSVRRIPDMKEAPKKNIIRGTAECGDKLDTR